MSYIKNLLIEANKKVWVVNRAFAAVDKAKYFYSKLVEKPINTIDIRKYKSKYRGKRCFIVGNGPSLNKTDMSKLKKEYCFGTNRIYLMKGFSPTFFVSVNDLVLKQCAGEIAKLKMPKFVSKNAYEHFKNVKVKDGIYFLNQLYQAKFSHDVEGGVWPGGTVTYVCLQLAFYMGFKEVILIGVDHNFTTPGNRNQEVLTLGDDPNHFSKKYFKGFKWNLPDLDTSEYAYKLAKSEFEKVGSVVEDATIDGKLSIFKKVKFKNLFI